MESHQEMSGNDKELAENVGESLGDESVAENDTQGHDGHESNATSDPLYVQKRLKQQKRSHDREMREMQARMAELK